MRKRTFQQKLKPYLPLIVSLINMATAVIVAAT